MRVRFRFEEGHFNGQSMQARYEESVAGIFFEYAYKLYSPVETWLSSTRTIVKNCEPSFLAKACSCCIVHAMSFSNIHFMFIVYNIVQTL